MHALLVNNLPAALIFGVFLLTAAVLHVLQWQQRRKKRRPPFTADVLRSPGQSLLLQMDRINAEINLHLVYLFAAPLCLYATYLSYLYFSGKDPTAAGIAVVGALTAVSIAYALWRVTRFLSERRRVRLRYDAELAVGQELSRLMGQGYGVYHDFPGEGFSIDHVVVGEKGLFAVETRGCSKPTSGDGRADATVEYNGKVLYFPHVKDLTTVEQAERQARWLSKWMTSAVGEPVLARAVVALPGWYVKRTSAEGIPVVNPQQFASLFQHVQPRPIPADALRRILQRLEQRCREVQPSARMPQNPQR